MKEKIQNMPILVFVFLGFAIAAYTYMSSLDTFTNFNNQIAQLKSQLVEKQSAYTKAKNASSEIPNLKQEIDILSQTLSRATELAPQNTTLKDLLQKISLSSKNAGVRLLQSKPGKSETKNSYETFPVEVEFEGSYAQLTLMMYEFSKEKLILHPQGMDLFLKDILDGQANLKLTGQILAFKYKEAK